MARVEIELTCADSRKIKVLGRLVTVEGITLAIHRPAGGGRYWHVSEPRSGYAFVLGWNTRQADALNAAATVIERQGGPVKVEQKIQEVLAA